MTSYTVTAMSGGNDKAFDSLEAARAYARELLGENDSLDIHLTADQREFVVSLEPPLIRSQQGNMDCPDRQPTISERSH